MRKQQEYQICVVVLLSEYQYHQFITTVQFISHVISIIYTKQFENLMHGFNLKHPAVLSLDFLALETRCADLRQW